MRVLFVSDVYFPRVNGVSTSIRTFRSDLAAAGIDTHLIVPAYPGAPPEAERGVTRVRSGSVPRDPEDRRFHAGALRAALAQALTQPVDLIHVHTPFLAHYAGVRAARAHGIPVVITYHTFFEEYLHHYVPLLPRRLGAWIARRVTRAQCAQVDAVIAPSAPMLERLSDYGVRTRLQVIPTGLPPERFVPGDGARFRAAQGLGSDRPLLLYVGRVAHEKNIEFLLHAFVELRRTRPEALLLIAGEGPARESLARLATRLGLGADVRFVGYLERETALADCYAAADLFVFASRTETQGLVLLEAMAQGRAVVSTAVLGTASILRDGLGARVVPEEPGAFAAAIAALLTDAAARVRLGAAARQYAQTWSSERMAFSLAELYRETLALAPAQAEPAGSLS